MCSVCDAETAKGLIANPLACLETVDVQIGGTQTIGTDPSLPGIFDFRPLLGTSFVAVTSEGGAPGTAAAPSPDFVDSVPGDITSTVVLPLNTNVSTIIETLGDHDFYRVNLVAGQSYAFATSGSASSSIDSYLSLRDSNGTQVAFDDDGGTGLYSYVIFTATTSGVYFLDAGTYNNESTGTYTLIALNTTPSGADTVAGNSATTATLTLNSTVTGTINAGGDHDFYAVQLTAGQSYTFTATAANGSTLDTIMSLRAANGNELAFNDDGTGIGNNSSFRFTATTTGTFYLDVGGFNNTSTGAFSVSMTPPPPLTVYTTDQIANQLTNGYWGGTSHHFNVQPGGALTVNLTGLTAAGQTLAREALNLWTDVTGITFNEVQTGGSITFDDAETGAFASASYSGGITTSARVNIGTGWLTTYGTGLNSYSFQTYIHEIGHALGLGHGGNYNGSANYSTDALYLNDAWATTVMSYFDQTENGYFANLGFTRQYVVSPLVADGVATTVLYGNNTLTRLGNTTYGFNNNSGRAIYDATVNPSVGYTVFDNGGTDTLDYSGFGSAQRINLNAELFSNVGGFVGNVSIARGSVIENAIGGSGADTLIGNAVANVLTGNNGDDVMIGGLGADQLIGGIGVDWASYEDDLGAVFVNLTLGQGFGNAAAGDTYSGIENARGSVFNDTLIGDGGNNRLEGRDGDDILRGAIGADALVGGAGLDTASYEDNQGSVFVNLLSGVGFNNAAQGDSFDSIENLTGSIFADYFIGTNGANRLDGGDGNDILLGALGADQIVGGNGSDTASFEENQGAVFVNLTLGQGFGNAAEGDTYQSIENLVGTVFYDTFIGDANANRLDGARGADTLTGAGGADTFVFSTAIDGTINVDRIMDFVSGTDRIELDDAVFSALGLGTLTAAAFTTGTAATTTAQRIIYDSVSGNLFYDADGSGSGAAVLFANLNGHPPIVPGDFVIV